MFAENPFVIPDERALAALREEEHLRKAEARLAASRMSVRDKTTFSSRMGGTMAAAMAEANAIGREDEAPTDDGDSPVARPPPRHKRENVADFVAKKREIFLAQMALDVKRAEIRKLEEKALEREEALAKSERMLEEDAARFDAFLKDNDAKVQDEIRKAELEAKRKNEKTQETKRLAAELAVVRAELSKRSERLHDLERYEAFLDQLTPQEHFDAVESARLARVEARRAARQFARDEHAAKIQLAADLEADIPAKEQALAEASRRGRTAEEAARNDLEQTKAAAVAAREAIPEHSPPPSPEVDDSDEDAPMFFTRPAQLPDIFTALEEKNLFLMQNGQEQEEVLEELQNKQMETVSRLDGETEALRAQVDDLEEQIAAERARAEALRASDDRRRSGAKAASGRKNPASAVASKKPAAGDASAKKGAGAPGASAAAALAAGAKIPLDVLAEKVSEAYEFCGFDPDPSMTTIQMLTQIEMKLERCLAIADDMPAEYVRESEKAREKARRLEQRVKKAEADRVEAEEKAARSLERSMAPAKKKIGKPMMTRSLPPSRKKKVVKEVIDPEEEELREFLAKEF